MVATLEHNRRKPTLRTWSMVVCAIVSFALHLMAQNVSDKDDDVLLHDAVELEIFNQEISMREDLERIADEIRINPLATDAFDYLETVRTTNNYTYFLTLGDSIIAWHNAVIPTNGNRFNPPSEPILAAENGWYMVLSDNSTRVGIHVLFCIRSHSPFDNEYLSDQYNPVFELSKEVGFSQTAHMDYNDVFDTEGRYLFTIENPNHGTHTPFYAVVADCVFLSVWIILSVVVVLINARYFARNYGRRTSLMISLVANGVLYIIFLNTNVNNTLGTSFLFSPQTFAYGRWIPSLAHLQLLATLFFVWCSIFFSVWRLRKAQQNYQINVGLILFAAFVIVNALIDTTVLHASEQILYVGELEISATFFTKLLVIFFAMIGYLLMAERVHEEYRNSSLHKGYMLIVILCATIACFAIYQIGEAISIVVGFVVYNIAFRLIKKLRKELLPFSNYVWMLYIAAAFLLVRLTMLNYAKEQENSQLLATNLSFQMLREDDPVAEQLLRSVDRNIMKDSIVAHAMLTDQIGEDELYSYIRKRYFDGYFSRYNLQIIRCLTDDCTLIENGTNQQYESIPYFSNIINNIGRKTRRAPHFFCLQDDDGLPCYLGVFGFGRAHLYVQIDGKPTINKTSYPTLLMDRNDILDNNKYKGYSYAKYYKNRLTYRFGDYNYPMRLSEKPTTAFTDISKGGFTHLMYSPQSNQSIVLSYPKLTVTQLLTNYSYIFIGLLMASLVILMPLSIKMHVLYTNLSIKEIIYVVFVLFVIALFIIICIISGRESIANYDNESRQSLSVHMNQMTEYIVDNPQDLTEQDADNMLKNAAELFGVDVSLYSPDGLLVGTSKRELLLFGLTSPLISDRVLIDMRNDNNNEMLISERIGRMEYISLYAPLLSDNDETIGYVNIPYFDDIKAMRRQLFTTLQPLTTSLLLIILLSIFFSFFLVRIITLPLKKLSSTLRIVDIGKENTKLHYPYDDEIGQIVDGYNKMTDQLTLSAEKLAVSEREATWREMARQIAHEIKNPLTPMKLSVQYMTKVWESRRENFEPVLYKTSHTLIEQIEQLTAVASQFSDIAKNTRGNSERVDIAAKIKSTVDLFAMSENATIRYSGAEKDVYVIGDNDQLRSVFNNLIKNALQSVDTNETVEIDVSLRTENDKVYINVSDNGHGIPEDVRDKIFRPNFTTKSTGMGLGLAITKTIITNCGGTIRFDTEIGVGTTFYVCLPLQTDTTK